MKLFIICVLMTCGTGQLSFGSMCPTDFIASLPANLQNLYQAVEQAEHDSEFQSLLSEYPLLQVFNDTFTYFHSCDPTMKDAYSDSLSKPRFLGSFYLFKDSFFLSGHFHMYVLAPLAKKNPNASEPFSDKMFEEMTRSQPWVEWNKLKNILIAHPGGAKTRLLSLAQEKKVLYRGASLVEFEFLKAIKHLAFSSSFEKDRFDIVDVLRKTRDAWTGEDSTFRIIQAAISKLETEPTLSSSVRKSLASELVMVVSPMFGAIFTAYDQKVATDWAFRLHKAANRVITFDVSVASPLRDPGVYVGIEFNYIQVGFRSASSRLNALKTMNEAALTYEDLVQDIPPNFKLGIND